MKDIFSDLYNKVLGFFRQAEKKEEENTKDVACNRLKFVLMQDRTNLTPELMDRMRRELIDLLSKYVEMDKDALELGFEQEGTQMALMLSIPVVRAKDEAEIEAILAKEDEVKAGNNTEMSDTSNEIKNSTDSDDEEEISIDETSVDEIKEDNLSEENCEDISQKNTDIAEEEIKNSDKESELVTASSTSANKIM